MASAARRWRVFADGTVATDCYTNGVLTGSVFSGHGSWRDALRYALSRRKRFYG